ncbi:TonB-dependent receptor [Sphingobium boeckii]|uniref:TonB-dependent receptor-like beta-barrel domain-containing protein n=1 Tax=Sphingobium boeckii TaxID=1082345 RepID=A0A7W9ALE9_9SPHN|nr:TonB-dependent receptor [Sphingobium boeckii]MBB5687579.1 hypothetical protein [Sphingobium boeckii]
MNRLILPGLAACALIAPAAVRAQAVTGAIRGEVTAARGPVARVEVVIEHSPTGTRSRTTADALGAFLMTGLRAGGPYILTIAAPGFETYSVSGIMLAAGAPLRLPIRLAAQQELLVTVETLRATRLSAGPMTLYDPAEIAGVASVRREIRYVARRDPLVDSFVRAGPAGVGGLSVDGVRLAGAHGPVSFDAIGQLAVKMAPYDVSEAPGGTIDAVLRSGGNAFSGTAFVSSAVDRDGVGYGAFLSGPVARDRLFFALAHERLENDRASLGSAGRDSRYSAKIDWNAAEGQRAALSYIHHDFAPRDGAGGWRAGETTDAAALHLNSDWSTRLSTQAQFTYRRIERVSGASVTAARAQAMGGVVAAHLQLGRHALKAVLGYERETIRIAPVSLPGVVRAGDHAASHYSAGVQDSWDADPALNITYGLRLDARRISGQARSVVQPRISATWRPRKRLTLRGGAGLFTQTGLQMPGDPMLEPVGAPIAFDPGSRLPSLWKSSLSLDYVMDLGPFGDGWRLGTDIVYAAVRRDPLFPDHADALTAVARIATEFDFGLAANVAYIRHDVQDGDPAQAAHPRFTDDVRSTIKFALDYAHAFVADYKTRLSLFGEWRSFRPCVTTCVSSSIWGWAPPDRRALGVDLHIDQDLPLSLVRGGRLKLFADVENVFADRHSGARIGVRSAF